MLAAIIMAGGSGERFWPLSTPDKPKQLLNIFSDKTMIRETVDRIAPIISKENIFIATNELQVNTVEQELNDIPKENIIIEPAFKDTAAAIGYSTLLIENRFKDKLREGEKIEIVVLASDHLVRKEDEFREAIKLAAEEASKSGVIVTLGIKPNKPETGYGYIEIKEDSTLELNKIYKVKRFREKPNQETAEDYLASGRYLWNSGMFIFTTETIFKNFDVLMEEHTEIFSNIKQKINNNVQGIELANLIREDFENFEKISIDFGIMEYSRNIRVIPVDIEWNDIGSFNALEEVFDKNDSGNIVRYCNVRELDSSDNIVIGKDVTISLLGVKNLVVVKNGDNILIANKFRTQDIKKIIKKH
ncbi:mannose-1-phosphate guanylyltransferase [Candidatus Cetobacterium colombiensis]|uniref:Mannose-1-phosphate guanylyltransferase n=1 Tax=Candidatus Cetobacterium colombiensis TaxID=3073100 RepID=A0ABU4WC94_9FUSO|nr:mannose-1-phosphate guanylyltransferase [Candidatus Cetobacterium colombiensis]MDX8337152.1 mannose-1-phosphate guanylyltransferase [Candidatus Cetobacterium colombiensis]